MVMRRLAAARGTLGGGLTRRRVLRRLGSSSASGGSAGSASASSTSASGTAAAAGTSRASTHGGGDDEQWTLFSELDFQADADKLRLAAFLDRLQQTSPDAATGAQAAAPPVRGGLRGCSSVASLAFEREPRAAGGGSGLQSRQLTPEAVEELLSRLLDGHALPAPELRWLLRQAAPALAKLPTVVSLPPLSGKESLTVVGDLHGQLVDLAAVFEAGGAPSPSNRYVFNGDFIDRGDAGVEVLAVLLSFALALPGCVSP